MKNIFRLIFLVMAAANFANADTLDNYAAFARCFEKITSRTLSNPDTNLQALITQVKSQTKNYVDACMEVLDRAKFTDAAGERIANPNDAVAIAVLRTMHNAHYSWMGNRDVPDIGFVNQNPSMHDIFDSTSSAAYLTKALFDSGFQFRNTVTSTLSLRPLRTNNSPTMGPFSAALKNTSIFGNDVIYAGKGNLIGIIQNNVNASWDYSFVNGGGTRAGTTMPYLHRGGGVLGSAAYLLMTVNEAPTTFAADGGVSMTRKWSKAIASDILCRELPLVRESTDVDAFTAPASSIPFRQGPACTKCHATMDRMAGVNRNFLYQDLARPNSNPNRGGFFPVRAPTNLAAETRWPTTPDPNYSRRPTNGVLFYRDYLGQLVNMPITSIADLGTALAAKDDMYICAAKKYYYFFTNHDVTIDDPTKVTRTAKDQEYYNQVVQLGRSLRTHQSLRQLIRDIISLPNFKTTGQEIE